MASAERTLVLKLVSDVSAAQAGIGKIDSKLGMLGKAAGAIGVAMLAKDAADAVLSFATDAVKAASSIGESTSKLNVLLGKSADSVLAFAKTAAGSYGISEAAALDYAGQLANVYNALGVSQDQSAAMSTEMLKLAADMASFNNASIEETLAAIGSGLRGEAEPLRRFGVLLDDATLRQQALAMGLVKTTKEALTPQQKALAAQAVILKQTGAAQGDFARTSGGLANQQRILDAQLANVTAEVGKGLMPVFSALVSFANQTLVPMIRGLVSWLQQAWRVIGPVLAPVVAELQRAFAQVWRELGPLVKMLGDVLLPILRFLAPIIGGALVQGIRAWATAISGAYRAVATLVGWVRSALSWIGSLIAKLKSIKVPSISLPKLWSATPDLGAPAASAYRVGQAQAVTINVYGGDPSSVQRAVIGAVRGYARDNGRAQWEAAW
jgi:phage-related protein